MIDEVLETQANGTIEEVFGAGTATVISPVGVLEYQGRTHHIAIGWIRELTPSGTGG